MGAVEFAHGRVTSSSSEFAHGASFALSSATSLRASYLILKRGLAVIGDGNTKGSNPGPTRWFNPSSGLLMPSLPYATTADSRMEATSDSRMEAAADSRMEAASDSRLEAAADSRMGSFADSRMKHPYRKEERKPLIFQQISRSGQVSRSEMSLPDSRSEMSLPDSRSGQVFGLPAILVLEMDQHRQLTLPENE